MESRFNYDHGSSSCSRRGSHRGRKNIFLCKNKTGCTLKEADKRPASSSTARQIQRASGVRTDVRPAVVRPSGGLREREEPRAFHTQHSARLLILLQVSNRMFIPVHVVSSSHLGSCIKESAGFIHYENLQMIS